MLPFDRLYRILIRVLGVAKSDDEAAAIRADGAQLLQDARRQGLVAVLYTGTQLILDAVRTAVRQDITHAARLLRRAPGFTLTASFVLALGLTATTTMFVLVDGVLLRPLPYPQADRIVTLWEANAAQGRSQDGPSAGNVVDWRKRTPPFSALAAWSSLTMTVGTAEAGEAVRATQVTEEFFQVFGVTPHLGRTFSPQEYQGAAASARRSDPAGETSLILSHRLWQDLGGDAALVGGMLDVDGRPWRVVGVMPPEFDMPQRSAFWVPWDLAAAYPAARFPDGPPRDFRFLQVAGRLADGVSIEAAASWGDLVSAQLAAEHPDVNRGWTLRLIPLRDHLLGGVSSGLAAMFGAVALLLVLTAINISSLMVARTLDRAQELALRRALGASTAQVLRQLVAEAWLVAVGAAALAVAGSTVLVRALLPVLPESLPRINELSVNPRVILFAAVAALLSAALGAGITAVLSARPALSATLQSGGSRTTLGGAARLRRALIVGELAVAVALLIGAGWLVRSWSALHAVDPGFDSSNVAVIRVAADPRRYPESPQVAGYFQRVIAALEALPAVRSAAAVTALPTSDLGSNFDRPYWPEGPRPSSPREADVRMATPRYFETLSRRVADGREFDVTDTDTSPRVVVVNERLAALWPAGTAVGRTLMLDYLGGVYGYRVVGVVADARHEGPRSDSRPEVFIPHAQNTYLMMNVIARTTVPADRILRDARAAILEVDRTQSVYSLTTLDRLMERTLAADRLALLLLTIFAGLGVIIAAAGVHAMTARAVITQRRELGLRLALGAAPRRLMWTVLRDSAITALLGAAVGVATALAVGRLAATFLFGIAVSDPLTIGAVAAIIVVVAVLSALLPARRAMKTDPISVLRGCDEVMLR